MSEHATEPRRLEIDWTKAAGGALAAVSSAVLLSTVGVAGTIIGAAVGSVVVTVGNSVYTHYLAASKARVAAAAVVARDRAARVREHSPSRATAAARMPARNPAPPDTDRAIEPRAEAGTDWRAVLEGLPWKRLAVVAAAIFALAMGVIVTFELVSGHAVSAYTGGSSSNGPRTSFGGGAGPATPTPTDTTPTPTDPTATDDPTTTTPPTTEPTTTEPEATDPTTAPPTPPAPTTAPTTAPATSAPAG